MNNQHFFRLRTRLCAYVLAFTAIIWGGGLLLNLIISKLFDNPVKSVMLWFSMNWGGRNSAEAKAGYEAYLISGRPIILCSTLVIVMLLGCFFAFKVYQRHLNALSDGIHSLFNGDESIKLQLPGELTPLKADLEGMRRAFAVQKKIALDSEQRKSELVAYLAHDLKTPLTSVLGYLELLVNKPDLSPEMRAKYTGIALEKARRLETLLSEFFDISRLELSGGQDKWEPVRLDMLLYQMTEEFYPLFEEKQLTCRTNLEDNIHVMGNSTQLARLFENLLKNAVSYSDAGSDIVIEARRWDGKLQITVSNRGLEIPEEQFADIFRKFYRLDEARQTRTGGAGLGLAVAKEITEMHGGSIRAGSTGKLTVFTVEFPEYKENA